MPYKTVANIIIDDFGPPLDFRVEGHPAQRIKRGEQVKVFLPHWTLKGEKVPTRVTIDIQVRRRKDEGTLTDFVSSVHAMRQEYHDFWLRRQEEINLVGAGMLTARKN